VLNDLVKVLGPNRCDAGGLENKDNIGGAGCPATLNVETGAQRVALVLVGILVPVRTKCKNRVSSGSWTKDASSIEPERVREQLLSQFS
jgi:hypothetical protein